jgi:hypothetical protein
MAVINLFVIETMSTNRLFSTQILRNISRVDQITVYTYEPRNLLLAYGIATLSSLSVLIFGLYAFLSNGVSYSSSVSAIIRTTQNPDVSSPERHQNPSPTRTGTDPFEQIMHVIGPQTLGSQPLPENIANTRLRFGMVQHNDSVRELPEDSTSRRIEHIGFGIEGSVTSLRRP